MRYTRTRPNIGHPDEGTHWIEVGTFAVPNYFLGQRVRTWKERENYEDAKWYEVVFIDLKQGRLLLRRLKRDTSQTRT